MAIDYLHYPKLLKKKIKYLKTIRYRPILNLSCNMRKQKTQLKYKGSVIGSIKFQLVNNYYYWYELIMSS